LRIGIGQDSHRFDPDALKPLVLGGMLIKGEPPLAANSDGDVIFHALTNAISSITCVNILGPIADAMCQEGITDSAAYVREAMKYLEGMRVENVVFSIECVKPKMTPLFPFMRENIAALLEITPDRVGMTATTGEGLSAFGRGEGIQVFCSIMVERGCDLHV